MSIDELVATVDALRTESHGLHALMWPPEGPTTDGLFEERATARGRLDREREFWVAEYMEATRYFYPVVGFGGYY